MSDPYFQSLFAERIGGAGYGTGTEIYKFEKIKRARRQALADHPERLLIDFGIGENDGMAPDTVRRAMAEEIGKPENRGYADNGIPAFKEAAARFMQRVFGVTLDPVTEVNHCIGSKPALAMIPACFINPGDVTLMTVPGYPVAGTHTRYYGGEVHRLPLRRENGFSPDLDAIPADVKRRAKLLVLNYPNSPTGAVATTDFYLRVVDFARTHHVVVVQDAAHTVLTFEGEPLSFLAVPGAREVGIEIHSMSKGFDMIGWRLGWFCGHPRWPTSRTTATPGSSSPSRKPRSRRSTIPPSPPARATSTAAASRSWLPCCSAAASPARCRAAPTSSTRPPPRAAAAAPSPTPRRRASTSSTSTRSSPCRGTTPGRTSVSPSPTRRRTSAPRTR
jgi:aspartate/methionine/tyrosine aminotransferase